MHSYREFAPPAELAGVAQCLWTHHTEAGEPGYRVLPDGCIDILFTRQNGEPQRLEVVGAMTKMRRFHLPPRQLTVGLRFRPGMAALALRVSAEELTDTIVPLADVLSSSLRDLSDRLNDARTVDQHFAALRRLLPTVAPLQPVHRAIDFLVRSQGEVRIEDLASMANLSPRQFRRVCLVETGLTPKRLARVMRFSAALDKLRRSQPLDWARLAADCGFYDQAHLIREFQELAEISPTRLAAEMSVLSNTSQDA